MRVKTYRSSSKDDEHGGNQPANNGRADLALTHALDGRLQKKWLSEGESSEKKFGDNGGQQSWPQYSDAGPRQAEWALFVN